MHIILKSPQTYIFQHKEIVLPSLYLWRGKYVGRVLILISYEAMGRVSQRTTEYLSKLENVIRIIDHRHRT